MGVTILSLQAKVTADTKEAEDSLKRVGDTADKASGKDGSGKGITGLLGSMLSIAGGIGIASAVGGAFGFLTSQVGDSIKAAGDYQQVQAQTNAVLTSTKDASGQTAQGIADLAEKMSTLTPFSRDATQSAENMLLTFTNIKGNLPQVTQTTLDFATAMHMDATSAALQLGKALNDPATGYSKLQREGVTFTKSQIATIKSMEASGNMAGAQAVMLQELQKEFGGSAQAAGNTFAGALQIAQNQLEDTKEKIGTALLPILAQLLKGLTPIVAALTNGLAHILPIVAGFFTNDLMPAIQPIIAGLPTLWGLIVNIGQAFMTGLQPAINAVSSAFSGMSGPGGDATSMLGGIQDVLTSLTPIAQQFGQFLGQALLYAIPIVKQLWTIFTQDILPIFKQVWQIIQQDVLPIVRQLAQMFVTEVIPAVGSIAQWVEQHLMPAIGKFADFVKQTVMPIVHTLVGVFVSDVLPTVEHVGSIITDKLLPPLEKIMGKILPILNPLLQTAGWIFKTIIGPAIGDVVNILAALATGISDVIGWVGNLMGWFGNLGGKIGDLLGHFGDITNTLNGAVTTAINGIGTAFSSVFGGLWSVVKAPINLIIGGVNTLIGGLDSIKIKIPDWSPIDGGKTFGINIPKIPTLAEGGIATGPTHAIIGEGREPEAVLPLSALGNLLVGAGVPGMGGGVGGGAAAPQYVQVQTTINLDGLRLAQVVTKHQPQVIRQATGQRGM